MTHEEQNGLAEALTDERIIELAVAHSNYREGEKFEVFSHSRIIEFARALAALQAPQEAGECATDGCGNTATGRFESGGVGSHHCPSCLAKIAALSQPEAQAVAEGWKPIELHIVFKDEGGPSNLVFVEIETIDGRSVRAGTWLRRGDYDILALSVHPSDLSIIAASPSTGGA